MASSGPNSDSSPIWLMFGPRFVKIWPALARLTTLGQTLANSCPILPDLSHDVREVPLRPNMVDACRTSANIGQTTLAKFGTDLANLCQHLANFGPSSTTCGQCLAEFGQTSSKLGRSGPISLQKQRRLVWGMNLATRRSLLSVSPTSVGVSAFWADLSKCGANSTHIGHGSPTRPDLGRFRPMLGQCRRRSASFGPGSTQICPKSRNKECRPNPSLGRPFSSQHPVDRSAGRP